MGWLVESLKCTNEEGVPSVLKNQKWDRKIPVANIVATLEEGTGRPWRYMDCGKENYLSRQEKHG